MQEASSVNGSKMPTANTEEELILAGIIAFHFKKLKCRYRRSPRGGIVFEKSFLPGRPGNSFLRICSLNCRTNGALLLTKIKFRFKWRVTLYVITGEHRLFEDIIEFGIISRSGLGFCNDRSLFGLSSAE
ncbi:hypothetical protein CDAR_58921 [Caerostris darwini]|uniref:Uncharacterized protein n=1 Tax=Caerostris darwini TaxID=1538125 RepID=A0AAV4X1T9_9ARAC|nr:hypothetical protein CDAR_58921 [Caerostris darwini]